MEWWVWVILVVLVLAAMLVFFQRRSRRRALGRGIEGVHGGIHEQAGTINLGPDPFGTNSSLQKPRDY